jgi:hypothetical protein
LLLLLLLLPPLLLLQEEAAAAEPEEPSLLGSIFGGERKFIFQIGARVLVLRFGSLW